MLPIEFINSMERQLGQELDAFCRALQQPAITSVRLNRGKITRLTNWQSKDLEQVPWCKDGYYLETRPIFTLDPCLHAGCYYVQEASSMFLQQVLEQYVRRDSVVLDLCAAPGGKSTLISEYLSDEGLLVTNEVVRQRVFVLSENIQKWGNGNAVVTFNKPQDFGERLPNLFDCVLVDAPCSGEGMFRKDEQAIEEWSERNVEICVERQRHILSDVWDALKPGGILIYSTCTYNEQENEQNVRWIQKELGADILPIEYDVKWGITPTIGYHFYPHKVKGEGLYMCALRKKERPYQPYKIKVDKKKAQNAVENEEELRKWLIHPEKWSIRQSDRFSNAFPAKFEDLVCLLPNKLTCISTGIGLGEMRGRQPVPQHSLSMAKDFKTEMFNKLEVDKETALNYLRSEALMLENTKEGIILLTFHDVPLGFVKNVGNHCNNLYPKEWRIRKV